MYDESNYRDLGVTFESHKSIKSHEAKQAKKFIDMVSTLTFDVRRFSWAVSDFQDEVEKRVMEVVKGIIRAYAEKWDAGYATDATRDARVLADTLDSFDR